MKISIKKIGMIGALSSALLFTACTPQERAYVSGLTTAAIIASYSYPRYYDRPYYYYSGRYYYGGYYRNGYYHYRGQKYRNGHYYNHRGHRYYKGKRYNVRDRDPGYVKKRSRDRARRSYN